MRFRRLIAVVATFAVLMNLSGIAMAGTGMQAMTTAGATDTATPHCPGMADTGVESADTAGSPAAPHCCADGACACVVPAAPGIFLDVARSTAAHVSPRTPDAHFAAPAPRDESLRPPIRIIAE